MLEEPNFSDKGFIRITAASLGISKKKWVSLPKNKVSETNYVKIMKDNHFDLLPIIPENGFIFEYLRTDIPNNFDNVKTHKILVEDVLSIETDIKQVINRFATESRTFFFLSFQRQIVGLITLSDFNCKQVQIFFFSLICELEILLSEFVNNNLKEEAIKDSIKKKIKQEDKNCRYAAMIKDYEGLVSENLETKMTEHFNFIDFFCLIKEFQLCSNLGFSKTKWEKYMSINELRKRIAHPTRSLIDSKNDIGKLAERLKKVEDLIFILSQTNSISSH